MKYSQKIVLKDGKLISEIDNEEDEDEDFENKFKID